MTKTHIIGIFIFNIWIQNDQNYTILGQYYTRCYKERCTEHTILDLKSKLKWSTEHKAFLTLSRSNTELREKRECRVDTCDVSSVIIKRLFVTELLLLWKLWKLTWKYFSWQLIPQTLDIFPIMLRMIGILVFYIILIITCVIVCSHNIIHTVVRSLFLG